VSSDLLAPSPPQLNLGSRPQPPGQRARPGVRERSLWNELIAHSTENKPMGK
jgi:hypothetical protein